MTDDLAAVIGRQGLSRAWALAPTEIEAAAALAAEQAHAVAALPDRWEAAPSTIPTMQAPLAARASLAPPPWSIGAIGAAYTRGEIDPVTVVDTLLERIDRLDPALESFVLLDRVGARTAARASAARWAAGAAIGPLDGIPIGIKDVIDVAGLPTRCHSRTTADTPAARDAAIVATMRAAGAIVMGKLATHEFAIGGPAFDMPFPPARNPWNRDHHPGGSSSGAGAAVAAGLVPLAIGTDTAGSVRPPASVCGVVGLKPGRGVLPVAGVVPLAPTLDHVGLLTRTVEDMRIAATAIGVDATIKPIGRVGYVRHFHRRDMIATPAVADSLDRVAAAFDATPVALPPLQDFALVNRIILQSEGFRLQAGAFREQPEALSALTRAALLPGAFLPPAALERAMRARQRLTAAVDTVFTQVDLLITASSMEPACRIDDPPEIARTYMLQARSPFNVTGHPALAMATGLSPSGLPLSVQFVAAKGEEGRLLAAAAHWERIMGGPLTPPAYRETPRSSSPSLPAVR